MKKCLLDFNLNEIEKIVSEMGEQKFHAKQIFEGIFSGKEISEITNISKILREKLSKDFISIPLAIHTKLTSKDNTIKYVYKLEDGNLIEGVLMSYHHGNTLCISTQVGCRMGCKFCASGLNGLIRNLTAGEMLGQVLMVNKDIGGTKEDRKITNVVLMGSGEPLDNYDEVVKFIRLINEKYCLNISQRNISLSTCGIPDKMRKLADDGISVTLTISLHAPTDEVRKKIMPIVERYSLKEVMDSARYYFEKTGRRIVFEYALIKGLNDTYEQAEQLRNLTKNLSTHINIIPLNSVKERGLMGTSKHQVYAFCDRLTSLGASASVRRTMGEDIEGACGQLRNRLEKKRGDMLC
ncbi:MAG: 23S rRNA (adenine(2503)-C(2))-methyltransferase RlmN [Clostridia bacterium]|nr:23S rRNA (adenine(2503)-C(2))-methyltransferase RlmN [Clostridia bacterium]